MAAQVETMAHVGAMPWHGDSTEVTREDTYNWPVFCQKAGLDWEVELTQVITADTFSPVNGIAAVRRKTDKAILGTVGDKYCPLQNKDAFAWFQPFLETGQTTLHTAGSLCGGSRVWVLAKLGGNPIEITKQDLVERYLLLSHSHDGSLSVRVGFTPIRVVCVNTLAMAHSKNSGSKLIRMKHTKGIQTNLENVRETINTYNAEFEATAEQYKMLARKSINQRDLKAYVRLVLGVPEDLRDNEISTRMKNLLAEVIGRCEDGAGNNLPGVSGTYWAAYNGVTEWLTHSRGRDADNRLNSLWYGDSAKINASALELAIQMAS